MIELTRPRPLEPGGHIAVVGASSSATPERTGRAAAWLKEKGFRVTLAENLFVRERSYLAGPDEFRAEELNRFLRDPSIDAFFFSRGGYGAMRILDRLDWDALESNPRPVVGYSDVTALHQAAATRAGVVGFHGPMLEFDLSDGLSPDREAWLWAILGGKSPNRWQIEEDQVLSGGRAEGVIFGGCLSLTMALIGTKWDFWIDDGIWFWEEVGEPVYRIDRMLTHLRLSGRLARLRAVMIGELKDCGDRDPEELDLLLNEFFGNRGIPVLRDLPFGHRGNNLALPIGVPVIIDSANGTVTFPQPATMEVSSG
ncbi:MAG: LD-carboxypeptidase [Thermoanaerobaculia bacterium]|nr:LD-carboxypeptidase [Thermoanaerobaculia bacterium]